MRRLILVFVLIFAASAAVHAQQKSGKDSVTIHVTLDKALINSDKWFYLTALEGNEHYLFDSCFVAKGVDAFTLRSYFPFNYLTYSELICSERIISLARLKLLASDNIYVRFNSTWMDYDITGSPANETLCKWYKINRTQYKKYKVQKDSIYRLKLPDNELSDAISKIDTAFKHLQIATYKARIPEQHTASDVFTDIDILKEHFNVPQSELDPLVEFVKQRFPDDPYVKLYPDGPDYPPTTPKGRMASNRIWEILGLTKTAAPKKPEIGETLSDFSLKSFGGDTVALSSIGSDYIFVDFWAGWCAPCRREIPFIKAALDKYGDHLKVVAVSLDNDEQHWTKAIAEDSSQMFTHLYLGNRTPQSSALCERFGIQGIPANFLIDKNRKIVAVNLRGEALAKKMAELLKAEGR